VTAGPPNETLDSIWRLANDEGFAISTKDNDFVARALVRGHPPRVTV